MSNSDSLWRLQQQLDVLLRSRKLKSLPKNVVEARRNWSREVVAQGLEEPEYLPSSEEQERARELSSRPIFVGGNPRSGTTLFRDLIDGHSAICVLPCEPLYFEFLQAKVSELNQEDAFKLLCSDWLEKLIDPMSQPPYWLLSENIADSATYIEYVRICKGWWKLMNKARKNSSYHRHVIPFMLGYATCLGAGKINTDTLYWVEKSPGIELYYDQLKKEFPEARFVNMIRNPKDSFVSLKASLINSGNSQIPLQYFLKSSLRFRALLRSQDFNDCLTVRYEQLVSNRQDVIKTVFAFLSLKPEEINLKQTISSMAATPNSSIGQTQRSDIQLSKRELLLLRLSADSVSLHFSYPQINTGTLLRYASKPLFYFVKLAYGKRHSFL